MAQFLKEFPPIDIELQKQIYDFIRADKTEMSKSMLYSSSTETKFTDEDKRLSTYKSIVNDTLFSLVEKLVVELSNKDLDNNYMLVRNDVTCIKYEPGGFFKLHEDYLGLTSNIIQEYTMIICMDSTQDCKGGRTIFHINDWFKHASDYSITPNHIVLFRKDLKHEGELLSAGHKHIITVNLWAVAKGSEAMMIKFTDDKRKYVIPISSIRACSTNYFTGLLDFKLVSKAYLQTHHATCTYEEFNPIYKILTGCYVTLKEYMESKHLINYYSIEPKFILLTSSENPHLTAVHASDYDLQAKVILTPNEADAHQLLSIIKEDNLPYIPFKMIMAEGTYVYGGEMSDTKPLTLKMDPLWFSVGELDQIAYWFSMISTRMVSEQNWKMEYVIDDATLDSYDSDFKMTMFPSDSESESESEDVSNDTPTLVLAEAYNYSVNFDLELYMPGTTYGTMIEKVLTKDGHVDLTGKYRTVKKFNESDTTNTYWSLDDNNILFVNKDIRTRIKKLIKNGLYNDIRKCLQKSRFTFPQQKEDISEDFCNESIYGNFKILYVNGFIRVDQNLNHEDGADDWGVSFTESS